MCASGRRRLYKLLDDAKELGDAPLELGNLMPNALARSILGLLMAVVAFSHALDENSFFFRTGVSSSGTSGHSEGVSVAAIVAWMSDGFRRP